MRMFVERSETENEITFVHRPYFVYVWIGAIAIWGAAQFVPEDSSLRSAAGFAWLIIIALVMCRFIGMRQYRAELSEAMKRGAVATTGSIFNRAQPLTVRIPKSLLRKYQS